jgi:ribosomal protein S18 acetylase RimI-like enzyme
MTRIGVALRPEEPDDRAVTRALYAAARADEMARAAWPSVMVAVFLDSQFAAQSAHYATNHPVAERWIVTRGDVPVGRLYVDRSGPDWRLLDIVIALEARGIGIGTALVTAMVRAARRVRAGVTLQVARDNPRAEALYRRLGFAETVSESVTHKTMTHAGKAPFRRSGVS